MASTGHSVSSDHFPGGSHHSEDAICFSYSHSNLLRSLHFYMNTFLSIYMLARMHADLLVNSIMHTVCACMLRCINVYVTDPGGGRGRRIRRGRWGYVEEWPSKLNISAKLRRVQKMAVVYS
jgi:hypothetical protein